MTSTRDESAMTDPGARLAVALAGYKPSADATGSPVAHKAAYLARLLQSRAAVLQTPQERKQQAELERMMASPHDKATMTQMTDQAFRSHRSRRAVDQMVHILDVQGVPRFFGRIDQTLMRGFQSFGAFLPGVAVPLIKEKMRDETANVILPAESHLLTRHLKARRAGGLRMNVNFLGEALLGEGEASRRMDRYLAALQNPDIECMSVKISTIYSQISSLAFESTVMELSDRLELLYRAATRERYVREDGSQVPKFVYLDMEEYRDMAVTSEAFMRALDRPGLQQTHAGIALQAYIPDAYLYQKRINAWARQRVQNGGAMVTVRIVKGANMEMERVEAGMRVWPQAPYKRKIETDANYKRMLREALMPENLTAVRVGVASHNLFDLALGLVSAFEASAMDKVQFEMLEGMANNQRRALEEVTDNLLLYAPATRQDDFIHGIGYLIRRLDENTGPENFLRHAFRLEPGSDDWNRLEQGFLQSFDLVDDLAECSRRTQDRRQPPAMPDPDGDFINEADTDFALKANVEWINGIISHWRGVCGSNAQDVPIVIGGDELFEGREVRDSVDPSRPGFTVARFCQATEDDVRLAVQTAVADPGGWRTLDSAQRTAVLARAAQELRIARGDLVGAAMAEGGKTVEQVDPEVSEAVDFCEFYRRSADRLHGQPGVHATGRGVVVVVSPWNFPIAIPCGGVAAALATGNSVILKPASDTVLTAWLVCQCFWRAGVPRDALQFAPCSGSSVGASLVAHPDVDTVILTGGTETALAMLRENPRMNLLAETGGKNATIVTALSDHEQAIKHAVQSAFGHAGQKCSATSLLILEEEIYEDDAFRRTLCDAVKSLHVGSVWDTRSVVGPVIRPPTGVLERGLKELEPGETWAVMPHRLEDNPNLWSPGVKWGVRPGSFTHMTELFGPVLGVMKAANLDDAIALVNQTGYGLTSGLESLDDREQHVWRDAIRAGNLYVNRVTTGAIVLRQPFGGTGKSAFGPGIKAGGPNYVAQLMRFRYTGLPRESVTVENPQIAEMLGRLRLNGADSDSAIENDDLAWIADVAQSCEQAMASEFGQVHDDFKLLGQDNLRLYLPVSELRIRVHPDDTAVETFTRVLAARTAGCRITVSLPPGFSSPVMRLLEQVTEPWAGGIEFVEETDEALASTITERHTGRVRYAAPDRVPDVVLSAVGDHGVYIASEPVIADGRIEMLWYLREQSISYDYHRYGNLGDRSAESRGAVL